jgi:hypothetical protein
MSYPTAEHVVYAGFEVDMGVGGIMILWRIVDQERVL